jgi:hypothetical protein
MKKAFIFTLDALFAVSIMAVFFVVYSFEMNVPKETYWLSVMGDTFMTSLDKSEVFYKIYDKTRGDCSVDSTDIPGIQNSLSAQMKNLSNNINGKLIVTIYQGANDIFSLRNTIEVQKGAVSETQETHIKRVFSDPGKSCFGIVELVISYG